MLPVRSKSPQKELVVCRTCLKVGAGATYFKIRDTKCDGDDQIKISQMLGVIVPELVQSLTNFPDICLECAQCVSESYRFRKKCLETENIIDSYMNSVHLTSDKLNLLEVAAFAKIKMKHFNGHVMTDWQEDPAEERTLVKQLLETDVKKNQPNILRHPTKNSKAETFNDKQKNASTPTKLLLKTTPNHIPQIISKRHFNLDDKKEETAKKSEVKVKGHRVYRIEKSFFVDDAGKSNLRLKDLSTMIGQPVPIPKPKNLDAKSLMVVRSTTSKGKETERASSTGEPLKKKFITVKKSQASAASEKPPKLVELEKPKEVSSEDVVEIKKEPVDAGSEPGKGDCPPGQDDEDTLSASETLNHEDVQSMLNSVDDADNYVDVPEFVQIDKFTIQDLQDLRAKGVVIPPDILQALPPVENALLRNTPVNATPSSETAGEKPKAGNVVKARPKPRIALSIKPARALMKSAAVSGKRLRKRRVKIAPVDSPVVSPKNAYVESLVYVPTSPKKESKKALGAHKSDCVLFTNYDQDGFYINDHDYLPTPYKRNRILTKEKGEIAYNCWICGSKHRSGDHVSHMSAHRTECGICETDFGTCYMLNAHMKSHASQCRQCNALVAHSRLDEHDKTCKTKNSSKDEQKKFPHIPAVTKTPVKRKSTSPCKKSAAAAKKMTPDKTASSGETASPREVLKRKKNCEVQGRGKGEGKMTLRSTPRKTEI